MIKNFSIFKRKSSENEKAPSHDISAKIGEEYVTIGACWTKESKGGKYLSCKLQDAFVDHTDRSKTRKAYAIADESKILLDTPVEGSTSPKIAPDNDLDAF